MSHDHSSTRPASADIEQVVHYLDRLEPLCSQWANLLSERRSAMTQKVWPRLGAVLHAEGELQQELRGLLDEREALLKSAGTASLLQIIPEDDPVLRARTERIGERFAELRVENAVQMSFLETQKQTADAVMALILHAASGERKSGGTTNKARRGLLDTRA